MKTLSMTLLLGLVWSLVGNWPVEAADEPYVIAHRGMLIPIKVDLDRVSEVAELRLFVSEDRGKTWKRAVKVQAGEKNFRFEAEKDGEYWFAVQIVQTDGARFPKNMRGVSPQMKVRMQTSARPETDFTPPREALKKELDDLRARVKELEARLKKLEQQGKE